MMEFILLIEESSYSFLLTPIIGSFHFNVFYLVVKPRGLKAYFI